MALVCTALPFFAETVLDEVHGPAHEIPRRGHFTVADGKQDFGKFGRHAYHSGTPHPEQRARAARKDGRGHADDAPRADSPSEGRHQGIERRQLALVASRGGPALPEHGKR